MKWSREISESRVFSSRAKSVPYEHPVFCGVRAHVHHGARPPCTWTNAHDVGASEPSIIVPCKKRRLGALTAVDHTSSNEWRHAGFAARKRRHGRMHPRGWVLFENLNSRSAFFFAACCHVRCARRLLSLDSLLRHVFATSFSVHEFSWGGFVNYINRISHNHHAMLYWGILEN